MMIIIFVPKDWGCLHRFGGKDQLQWKCRRVEIGDLLLCPGSSRPRSELSALQCRSRARGEWGSCHARRSSQPRAFLVSCQCDNTGKVDIFILFPTRYLNDIACPRDVYSVSIDDPGLRLWEGNFWMFKAESLPLLQSFKISVTALPLAGGI